MSDAGSDTQHQRIYIVALLFSLKQKADHWNRLGSFSPYLERNIDMKLKYTVPCWLLNKRLSWPSAVRLFPRTDFPLLLVCPKFRSDTNLSSRWNPHCDGVFDSSGPKISSVITVLIGGAASPAHRHDLALTHRAERDVPFCRVICWTDAHAAQRKRWTPMHV